MAAVLTGKKKKKKPCSNKKAFNRPSQREHDLQREVTKANTLASSSPILLRRKLRLWGAKQTHSSPLVSNCLNIDQIYRFPSQGHSLTPTQGSLACCKPRASLGVFTPADGWLRSSTIMKLPPSLSVHYSLSQSHPWPPVTLPPARPSTSLLCSHRQNAASLGPVRSAAKLSSLFLWKALSS